MQGETWNSVRDTTAQLVLQAQNFYVCGARPGSPSPAPVDPWVDLAASSIVWQHVPESRDAGLFQQHVEEAVAALTTPNEMTFGVVGSSRDCRSGGAGWLGGSRGKWMMSSGR